MGKVNPKEDKSSLVEIGVDIFLLLLSFVVGIKVWASLIGILSGFVPIKRPYLWSTIFMIVINAGHFFLGFFDVESDISDIPTRGIMTSFPDFVSIIARIAAFVTICPSVYLKSAVRTYRANRSERDYDDSKNFD